MSWTESSNLPIRLHHIGVAVPDMEKAHAVYLSLGYTAKTALFHDPVQTAHVQFLQLPKADHYLELVAPDGPDSFLAAATTRKQPLHHLCYATPDIDSTCGSMQAGGWRLISEPTPAVAFEGRPIAWLMGPDKLIVELVQEGGPGSL